MTRINIVPVQILTNSHLMAEYRELPRVFTRVHWRIEKGQTLDFIKDKISKNYILNSGHETFFNDKLKWLYLRYISLYEELLLREYNLDIDKYNSVKKSALSLSESEWWNDYNPAPEDIYLNMARLVRRSKLDDVLKEANSDS